MKKEIVMASIPYQFLKYWERMGRIPFGKTKLNFEYSCGFPMEMSLTYASIKKITWEITPKGTLKLNLYAYTKKGGWDNYSLGITRRGNYIMTGNNLPLKETTA